VQAACSIPNSPGASTNGLPTPRSNSMRRYWVGQAMSRAIEQPPLISDGRPGTLYSFHCRGGLTIVARASVKRPSGDILSGRSSAGRKYPDLPTGFAVFMLEFL